MGENNTYISCDKGQAALQSRAYPQPGNTKFDLTKSVRQGGKTQLLTGQHWENGRTKTRYQTRLISLRKALWSTFVHGSVRLHLAQALSPLP